MRNKTLLIRVPAITNNCKLGDLKQQIVILLYFWRSEVQNQCQWAEIKMSAELGSLPKLQERIHSLPLAAPVAAGIPWLVAVSLSMASFFKSLSALPSHYLLLFCVCYISLRLCLKKLHAIAFRVHLDNPG